MQQYSAKELEAWRSGTWSEWTCTNCQTVGWSGQKKCRHCGVKKRRGSSLRSKCNLGADGHSRNQTARHKSLSSYNKWRHNYNLYVETIQHNPAKVWTCLLSSSLGPERSSGKSSKWRKLSAASTWMPRRWSLRGKCWISNSQS